MLMSTSTARIVARILLQRSPKSDKDVGGPGVAVDNSLGMRGVHRVCRSLRLAHVSTTPFYDRRKEQAGETFLVSIERTFLQ